MHLIGSWSSLSSLLCIILIPLFFARGQPDRLQSKKHIYQKTPRASLWTSLNPLVAKTLREVLNQIFYVHICESSPSVWGIVACDMPRAITARSGTPASNENMKQISVTSDRPHFEGQLRCLPCKHESARAYFRSWELDVIIPRMPLSASWQLDSLKRGF